MKEESLLIHAGLQPGDVGKRKGMKTVSTVYAELVVELVETEVVAGSRINRSNGF